MRSFALAAIGRDRGGIVAAISKVLFEEGCNLEDSSMSLLRGNFAVMLVFSAPDEATKSSLDAALRPVCDEVGVTFSVLEVDDRARTPQPTHVATVYGADKPGILAHVSSALSEGGANISNLSSRLVGDIYVLTIEAEIAGDAAAIEAKLQALSADVGVDVSFASYDADVL
ncbi:MAG: ACT domain-containing protein [Actinobacteria bacterium]|nr:ACT domain-containing protein [Actinomycetota bacterium]